jgi:TPR repeat protein
MAKVFLRIMRNPRGGIAWPLSRDLQMHNSTSVHSLSGESASPKITAKPFFWYTKAASQRNANAQYNLGVMYTVGRGVSADEVVAARWYREAGMQGHADAQANLGNLYLTGRGVERSETSAIRWHLRAAAQGLARAKYTLGLIYENPKSEVHGRP